MAPRTCVGEAGRFIYGIHKASYDAVILRQNVVPLNNGLPGKTMMTNRKNFPHGRTLEVNKGKNVNNDNGGWVFEIPNAFPFLGSTFILKGKADGAKFGGKHVDHFVPAWRIDVKALSGPEKVFLAQESHDAELLKKLVRASFDVKDYKSGEPKTIKLKAPAIRGISDKELYEVLANSTYLPDSFKRAMVLFPGAQGDSPVLGDFTSADTNIFEYLRENSYIPWGHYAANMSHDCVRYKASKLTFADISGLRHLYYQRIYVQLAHELKLSGIPTKRQLTSIELENLRTRILDRISKIEPGELAFNASIWGQNFGFDYAPSGHKLHASHQQVHQQYALVPATTDYYTDGNNGEVQGRIPTYVMGDEVAAFSRQYDMELGTQGQFFNNYINALAANERMDVKKVIGQSAKPRKLIISDADDVLLFVPKAQRSPWELQIMVNSNGAGNILELKEDTRKALDKAILMALKVLEAAGASMVTAYEISKRFDDKEKGQRLIYCFLPQVPGSPAGWSERQNRWIVSHYPEDFAEFCRKKLEGIAI